MKKILTVIAIVGLLSFSGSANAQTKIGYISVDNVVGLLPEVAKIDSLLERYQVDSLNPEYASLVQRYQFDDSLYRDSVKTPKAVRDEIAKKLPGYIYQIQNWQQIVNQALEAKQNELLAPLYRKVYDAIKLVAKEKGYTHVFNKEALLVAPDGDDMLTAVATKLKISVPKNPPAGK
ncbi:MAG TPA: OmpH family outer membrane protein [Chitinophagaceae bacterium]|jgi:outer membrane protein|nr:OmpH family outer membrane protein [Chitinophagaceae bacterium]HNU13348.1 OmpH family outer membrane protein [Chitinophagaceae bacterium]